MPGGIRYADQNTSITYSNDSSSNYVIWYNWNQNYTSSTSTTITVSNATANDTWIYWNETYVTSAPRVAVAEPEGMRRFAREERARIAVAEARARRILKSMLTPEQQRQFDQHQFFEVQAHNGTVRYLLARGRSANVYRLDAEGKPVKRFCVHPGIACPDEDTLLAQKLLLETNPAEFERLANVHPIDERGHRLAQLVRRAAA